MIRGSQLRESNPGFLLEKASRVTGRPLRLHHYGSLSRPSVVTYGGTDTDLFFYWKRSRALDIICPTIVFHDIIKNRINVKTACHMASVAEWLKRLALKLLAPLRWGSGSNTMRGSCQLLTEGCWFIAIPWTMCSSSCGNWSPCITIQGWEMA